MFKEQFGSSVETFFVFTGTAANVLGSFRYYQVMEFNNYCIIQHIWKQDECGAPEKFTGCKVLTVDTPDGKINANMVEKHMHGFDFEHHSQPKVISITQSTEMGTVYTSSEIREIADFAHSQGMLLHMDGAQDSKCCCFI